MTVIGARAVHTAHPAGLYGSFARPPPRRGYRHGAVSYARLMAIIRVRRDPETHHALHVLTQDGASRSLAVRQAVIEAASRHERAAAMKRAVLSMSLGEPDGVNVADELSRERDDER